MQRCNFVQNILHSLPLVITQRNKLDVGVIKQQDDSSAHMA